MVLFNKNGLVVLIIGNKSEMVVGYVIFYGDMVGGFLVFKDVFKIWVYWVVCWCNQKVGSEIIFEWVIIWLFLVELVLDQVDLDFLFGYDELDVILECYVEQDMSVEVVICDGFDCDIVYWVVKFIDCNEYKWCQVVVGLWVSCCVFGKDCCYLIINGW